MVRIFLSSKLLLSENIGLSKNAILFDLIPTTTATASINKLQVNREDGLPIKPVPDDSNDDDASQINENPPIYKNISPKIYKPMYPLLTDYIKVMYADEGPLENTTENFVLEKKKRFNYHILLGELMYVYITCHPDIGYMVTTLLKFSSTLTEYHYILLKGVAIFLRNTIELGIHFH